MRRLSRFASIVIAVSIVLLAMPTQVSAKKPEEVVFTFDLTITIPGVAAEGTFVATGAIEDEGSVSETFRFTDDGNVAGVFEMEGTKGTITMTFHLTAVGGPPDIPAVGRFVIKSGTGAYENIHGVGAAASTTHVGGFPVTIDATFTGKMHIDP